MKKGFTLIELMISIVLIALMSVMAYESIDNLRHRDKLSLKHDEDAKQKTQVMKVMYEDILEASSLQIQNTYKNSVLHLVTTNTYHDPRYRYVIYKLSRKNTLIRIELPKEIQYDKKTPHYQRLSYEEAYVDEALKEVSVFKISPSKDKKSVLIYIDAKGAPLVFRVAQFAKNNNVLFYDSEDLAE